MTPLAETLNTDVTGALLKMTSLSPLKRPGTPEEITGICCYLASDRIFFHDRSGPRRRWRNSDR